MKTIFIVDDEYTNRMMAKTTLDGIYKTFALPSAEKMFKLAENIVPDLILLDVSMPEMDGFTAIQQLKSDLKLKEVPVVFLTAAYDVESEIRGFEAGALDFIHKPFAPPILIKRIARYMEQDRLMKEGLWQAP